MAIAQNVRIPARKPAVGNRKTIGPFAFFRVNRKYFVQQNAIKKIKSYPKIKLQLEPEPVISDEIIISQENGAAFKE